MGKYKLKIYKRCNEGKQKCLKFVRQTTGRYSIFWGNWIVVWGKRTRYAQRKYSNI